jgi:hypothetical protein
VPSDSEIVLDLIVYSQTLKIIFTQEYAILKLPRPNSGQKIKYPVLDLSII